MAIEVSTGEVIAFRLNAHQLTRRVRGNGLLDAAGRCGIQNSPPGSALLALHARVRDLTEEQMAEAVAEEKSLLQTWCMRGSPYYFPSVDAPVFTTGVLPPTEEAMRHFIPGVEQSVGKLTTRQRGIWEAPGPWAPDQPLGQGVVHFCIRILTLQRVVCFAPRAGNKAPFVLVEEWLGRAIPDLDPEVARAELVRRYLRCYGPSTRRDFASWVGITAGNTDPWWSLVEDELTQVEYGGTSWLLGADLDALRSAPKPKGVRLLPPRDPYTQMRDRGTIVDEKYHREVWKPVGEPGAVLADGEIRGTWRPRKTGRTLTITITTFGSLPAGVKKALHDEAEQVAPLRGASSVNVVFDAY